MGYAITDLISVALGCRFVSPRAVGGSMNLVQIGQIVEVLNKALIALVQIGQIVEVLNKALIALAVIVGGAWAIYTSNGELKRENARAQLEKLQRDISASERENIDVDVAPRVLRPTDANWLIEVRVTLQNSGARELTLELPKYSLRVSPILPAKAPDQPTIDIGKQVRAQPIATDVGGGKADISSVRAPFGSKTELLYVVQVPQPGRYLVEFSSQVRTSSGTTKPDSEWGGSRVLEVTDDTAPK